MRAMTTDRSRARSAGRQRDGAASTAPSRARPARARWRAQAAAWGFLAPVVLYLLAFYAYPLYRNIDLSIRSYTLASFVTGDAPFAGFANYISIFHSPTFAPALINTTIFVFVSIAFQFAIGLALAVFFYRKFRLSGTLRALFLVPWLLPLLVSASTWSWMLNSDSGIVNSFLQAVGRRAGRLADLAALVAGGGADREHLDRHPVQPRHHVQRPAEHLAETSSRPPRSTARTGGSASGGSPSRCCARCPRSPCCSASSTR